MSGTIYKRGSLVLVPFPFTDLSATKRRPALVVSPDWFNEESTDVVLVAVTSVLPKTLSRFEVLLSKGDLSKGTIPRKSIIRTVKLFTFHRDLIMKEVAYVKEEKIGEVLGKLKSFFNEQPKK